MQIIDELAEKTFIDGARDVALILKRCEQYKHAYNFVQECKVEDGTYEDGVLACIEYIKGKPCTQLGKHLRLKNAKRKLLCNRK